MSIKGLESLHLPGALLASQICRKEFLNKLFAGLVLCLPMTGRDQYFDDKTGGDLFLPTNFSPLSFVKTSSVLKTLTL